VGAQDDPLVRELRALQDADDVGGPDEAPGLVHPEANRELRPARDPVGERKPALPAGGNRVPRHALEDLHRRAVGEGGHGDRQEARLRGVDAAGRVRVVQGEGRAVGSEWVAPQGVRTEPRWIPLSFTKGPSG
jgi:hypothetical protein